MTTAPNNNGRRVDRGTVVSLGLVISLVGGVWLFASKIPSKAEITVIVHEAVGPVEAKLHDLDVRLSRIEERLARP